jgi:hypothetical protein
MLQRVPGMPHRPFASIPWMLDSWRIRLLFSIQSRMRFSGRQPQRETAASLRADLIAVAATLRSVEWQFWLVLILAIVVTVVTQDSMPFWYGGSDHSDYYWYGRYLLGDNFRGYAVPANWRTPGMGLFHILSGTVLFDTWRGFIALSAAFSAAIPVFSYLMVRPHSHNFALLAGTIAILSMSPFLYAHFAGADHVYFFFHALLLLLCVRYFQRHVQTGPALLTGIVGIAAFASLIRPVAALILWVFVVFAVIMRPRDRWRLAAAASIYMTLMAGWVLWDRAYGTNGGATIGLGYPQLNDFGSTAERRLGEAYFSSRGLFHVESDQAATLFLNSQTLRAVLRSYLAEHTNDWRRPSIFTPSSLFARYADEPRGNEKLLDALFVDRNYLYFSFIVRAVEDSLGNEAGLSLLYRVASEHGTTGLYGIIRNFVIHPAQLLIGVTPNLSGRNIFLLFFAAKYQETQSHIAGIWNIPDPLLSADLGPANALILRTLRRFIDDYPQYWSKWLKDSSGWLLKSPEKYQGDPEGFYQLLLHSNIDAGAREGFISQVVNWYLGPAISGRVYTEASLEILRRYPKLALLFYNNFLYFSVARRLGDVTAPLDRSALAALSDAYFDNRAQVDDDLPRGLIKELTPVVAANEAWKDAAALQTLFYLIAPIFVFVLIASLPFLCNPATIGPCLFLLLDYCYEVALIAIFGTTGTPRYEAVFLMLPVIIACMIFGQKTSDLKKRARLDVITNHLSATHKPA